MNFISSIYLWLLPLISVPLLIYLFNRSKFKDLHFSSLIFLSEIKKDSINKINIINILLLVIRTLIILFFILMMSRPTYNSSYKSQDSIDSLVILAIDNSLSMSNIIQSDIKNIMKNTIEPFNNNTIIKIITLGKNKILYNGKKESLNLNSIKIKKTFRSVNSKSINKILTNNNTSLNTFLFIISDGQQHLIKDPIHHSDKDNFYIHYIYLNSDKSNLSITKLDIDQNILLPNDKFRLSATIQNNGTKDIEDKFVSLVINNLHIGRENIKLPHGKEIEVQFEASIDNYGEHLCYLELSDDDIKEDNTYYFITNIQESINVDIISNNENLYLYNALNAFNLNQKIVDIKYYTLDNYLESKIDRNILFVLGLDNLTKKLKNKIYTLNEFENFNLIVIPDITDLNFIPISSFIPEFKDIISNRIEYDDDKYLAIKTDRINNNYLSKIYKGIPDRNIKIFNYIDMKSDNHTLISLHNNSVLLNRYLINENITFDLLSISLDLESSNWPLKGSIIPFIQYLVIEKKILAYSDIHTTLENMKIQTNSKITTPSEKNIIFKNINKESFLNELGFYKTILNNKTSYFAVNLSNEELLSEYLKYKNINNFLDKKITLLNTSKQTSEHINKIIVGYDFWRLFLYLILILLFLEMFLSTLYVKND